MAQISKNLEKTSNTYGFAVKCRKVTFAELLIWIEAT